MELSHKGGCFLTRGFTLLPWPVALPVLDPVRK